MSRSSSESMPQGPQQARDHLLALLEWHELMGVTACLGEAPGPSYGLEPAPLAAAPAGPQPGAPAPRPPDLVPQPATARRPLRAEPESVATARGLAASCDTLDSLRQALETFEGCALRATATRLCFADGNPEAAVMVIGEAPGAEEDRQGRPFVGQSGQLLDRMLAMIGLDRRTAYITNLIPWRPPGNRSPSAAEIAVCQPFLERQIELVQPRQILFVGGISARALLDRDEGVTKLRGRPFTYTPAQGAPIPALVTFHPAYLLRQPVQKRYVWRDLLRLRRTLGRRPPPESDPASH
ncbi:uracil-DNA glycosylase (plasmid) [Geminicoccaceae bacterium 1502E]|nr:uracil-DNA glycosylase [Geminicoccaceae bacterium 1502E]